jgi:hypothetical protein
LLATPRTGLALVVFEHALDGQRQVVVARPLSPLRGLAMLYCRAWCGRPSASVPGRDDADGLAFQHREGHGAEVQHHVVRVVFAPDLR